MRRYLLVEVRVGKEDDIPSVRHWSAYKHIRDRIGRIEVKSEYDPDAPTAEVGEVLELTDQGIVRRFGRHSIERR